MLTKNIPYTFNRGGYFYFSRRVPSDLLHHYSYPRIVQGLRTKSQQTAKTRALVAAAKLDERWSQLRLAHGDVFGAKLQKVGTEAALHSRSYSVEPQVAEALGPTVA